MRRVQQWNVYSASPLCVPVANQVWKSTHSFLLIIYRGFLKWWVSPTNPWGFPTKNDHFGVFWGKNHHFFGNTLTWKFAKRPLVFSVWSDSRSIKVNDTFLQCVSPAVGSWVGFFFRRGRSSWTTAPRLGGSSHLRSGYEYVTPMEFSHGVSSAIWKGSHKSPIRLGTY